MSHRRGIFTTALATTALSLLLAGFPGAAFGLEVLIAPLRTGVQLPDQTTVADVYNAMDLTNPIVVGEIVGSDGSAVSADCPAAPCQVSRAINQASRPGFTISAGTAIATKASGSINKVTLNNLTIQATQSGITVVALYFHWFTGVDTSVQRAYGQAASGSLCRPDANNNCQTAVGDSVRLNSGVIYAKNNANLGDPVGCLNTNLCQIFFLPQSQNSQPYKVLAGGVSNNNYFPESTLPTTTQGAQCTLGNCATAELIASALTFTFTAQNDAVIQKATQTNVSGLHLNEVVNILHAEAVEIDIAPGPYNPDNNDINLSANGMKTVSLLSQKQGSTKIFDTGTVDLSSVGQPNHDPDHPCLSPCFAVGDGERVAPVSVSFPGDLNRDGEPDLIFTFSIPDIGPKAIPQGTCSTTTDLGGVGVGVLSGTADFTSATSTTTTQRAPKVVPPDTCTTSGNTTTCTHCALNTDGKTMTCTTTVTTTSPDLPFTGQQTFTCAPKAS